MTDALVPGGPIEVGLPDSRTGVLLNAAIFDSARTHRFSLMRRRESGAGDCLFIMLNPSTADENILDPTVTRCRNFAYGWGYNRFYVANIFSLRSTDPEELYKHPAPNHAHNDQILRAMTNHADMVVCAWGVHGAHQGRGKQVEAMLRAADRKLYVLGLNKDGSPKHPLYLRGNLTPTPWTP